MNATESDASLLLDLVNSRLTMPGAVYDEIADPAQAREWLRARGGTGSTEEIAGAREAREALVSLLRGLSEVEVLAPWLSAMRKTAVLQGVRLGWRLDVPDRLSVGARAIEEWATLQTESGSRIRPCVNPECQHFLIDRSKGNVRKWHSMETCGNRMKSRRHYARIKTA